MKRIGGVPDWRDHGVRLMALLLLAGLAEAVVVAWRAYRIAEIESWPALVAASFGAGAIAALHLLPALLVLEVLSGAAGRLAARRAGERGARIAASATWSLGGLGAAIWILSHYERFQVAREKLPIAALALGMIAFGMAVRSPGLALRRTAAAGGLLLAAMAVGLDARTTFGQYPTFHLSMQWLILLVAAAALGALGFLRWPRTFGPRSGVCALTACVLVILPLHWDAGTGDGDRALVQGLGWMTLPQDQLMHPVSLNPVCNEVAQIPQLPPEARAQAFLTHANFDPLRRDLEGLNLLLVILDAVRADRVGAYGADSGLTPNIDALAAESVLFENAYASSSGTLGTVGALFCMAPPSWTELTTEKVFWRGRLGEGCVTIAQRLAARGYHTRANLYYYVAGTLSESSGYLRGFEMTSREKNDLGVVRRALEGIERKTGAGGRPTFSWLHLGQTHEPYIPASESVVHDDSDEARYDAAVSGVDAAVGELVAGLKQRGLWEDTVLVLLSDHGEEFGDHGGRHHNRTVYDEMIRIPLMVHDPRLEPQRVSEDVVVSDLGAWLLWEHGGKPDPDVVSRVASSAGMLYGALGGVRIAELLSNTGIRVALVGGPRKAMRNLTSRYDELYDRDEDPGERRNLIGSGRGQDLILALDRYEALRRCTRRANVKPLWGKVPTRTAANLEQPSRTALIGVEDAPDD